MSEIHGAVGSYVVHALDDSELDEFQEHLDSCETCRREVAEFSETTAQLSMLSAAPPPPALRSSILSAIQQVRPLPPEDADVRTAAAPPEPLRVVTPPAPAAPEVPDELAARRRRRSTRALSLAVAAALVAVLGVGTWAVSLVQNRQTQVAASQRMTALLSAPDARTYPVTLKNGARGSFVVSKSRDEGAFVSTDLPGPGSGRDYELWTVGSAPVANRVFDASGRTTTWFEGGVRDSKGFAISIEADGGSRTAPTDVQKLVTA